MNDDVIMTNSNLWVCERWKIHAKLFGFAAHQWPQTTFQPVPFLDQGKMTSSLRQRDEANSLLSYSLPLFFLLLHSLLQSESLLSSSHAISTQQKAPPQMRENDDGDDGDDDASF
jgi:hypothetical protein